MQPADELVRILELIQTGPRSQQGQLINSLVLVRYLQFEGQDSCCVSISLAMPVDAAGT